MNSPENRQTTSKKPPRPLSELSARYNGFTLGVFLTSMRDAYSAKRYPEFRRRVLDFLAEVRIKVPIARAQRVFVEKADATLSAVLAQSKGVSSVLYDFIGLGAMAVLYASNTRLMTVEQAMVLRDRWVPVLQRHRVPESAYDEWLAALPTGDGVVTAEDVLTPAALLLALALEAVKPDNDTCFVAMPFRSPILSTSGASIAGPWTISTCRQYGYGSSLDLAQCSQCWRPGIPTSTPTRGSASGRCGRALASISRRVYHDPLRGHLNQEHAHACMPNVDWSFLD